MIGRIIAPTLALVVGALAPCLATPAAAQVYITELLAINDSVLTDEDGDHSDWLELHNAAASPVDLTGWHITDDDGDLTRWQLPALTLAAGAYEIVFASNKDRAVAGAELHTNFRLGGGGEYLALVHPDGTTIEHEYAPQFPEQQADVSYGLASDLVTERCFFDPTPGAENDETTACATVDALAFSAERGFYDAPLSVAITTTTPAASIYYTLDGSAPTDTAGTLYTAPIGVATTSTLRAAAFAAGLQPTPSVTHTYIFLDDVLLQTGAGFPDTWAADYEMDPDVVNDARYSATLADDLRSVPTISMVMDLDDLFDEDDGIYNHPSRTGIEWERPVSVELILADGTTGFQVNAGTRIQGDLSRSLNRKKSFRLAFKSIYGPSTLDYPLFGPSSVTSFDKIRLRASSEKSWSFGSKKATYVRDQWVRNTQLAMGRPASRGNFVHLYLNGLYWGLYNAVEKPDENFAASHLGGDPEDWDVHKHPFEIVNGNRDAWDAARAITEGDMSSPAAYAAIQDYIDVPNLIDYFITNIHAGTTDWDGNNWFAGRRRETGEGFKFFSWDAEQSMVSLKTKRVGIAGDNRPSTFYSRLRDNLEFRVLFGDHVHRHFLNDGALTAANAGERFARLTAEIDRAINGESARWGDTKNNTPFTRDDDWLVATEWLRLAYFPRRTAIVLDQFRSADLYPTVTAPTFNLHGGHVAAGFSLDMTAPAGTIYYTTDGSDPRLPGGTIAGTATAYSGPLTISSDSTVRSRALAGSEWSALNEADFTIEVALRVTELMYHPADPPQPSAFNDDDFEFIEIANVGAGAVDLDGIAFTDGVGFTFGPGMLAPGARIVLVSDEAAFESRYGPGIAVAGQYTGNLGNAGETVRLDAASGGTILEFTYDDGWYPETDGTGSALVVRDAGAERSEWDGAAGWRAGAFADGTPTFAEIAHCADGVDNDGDGDVDLADAGCASAADDVEDPECDDGVDNDGDGDTDVADGDCPDGATAVEAPAAIDTFVCYQARTSRAGEKFEPLDVTLTDEFDGAGPYTVRDPRAICLAAAIDGGTVVDADVHLEGYQLRDTDTTPDHVAQETLLIHGLGPVFMDTNRVERLLVPAAMDPAAPVSAPIAAEHEVDHYKCYKARVTRKVPAYWPKGVQLRAVDPLEDRAYDLKRPDKLCTPVDKNGEGIKAPDRKLICYKARRAKGEPKHVAQFGLHTATQFGPERLETRKVEAICVPAR